MCLISLLLILLSLYFGTYALSRAIAVANKDPLVYTRRKIASRNSIVLQLLFN